MNLILFEASEISIPLTRKDARAVHLLTVLRRNVGDTFDAGLINGARGKGRVAAINADSVALIFTWETPSPPLDPLVLVLGLPRPQTARKILQESAALGLSALHFFRAEKSEASYAQSTLWSTGEWRRHLVTGAAQAFDTRLPEVTHGLSLPEALSLLPNGHHSIALDNYESPQALSAIALDRPVTLGLGPERGWSASERDLLRARGFLFAHLGARVLRTETAVVAAVSIVKARLGLM